MADWIAISAGSARKRGVRCRSCSSPLLCHCFCNAGIKARSLFPALRAGRLAEDALFASGDDIGRLQRRQVPEPEACALCLAMAELPRLDALREFPVIHDQCLGVFV